MVQKVYSFDVFDTLITRKVGTPLGIFLLMQSKLHDIPIELSAHQIKHFAATRSFCEKLCREETSSEDVTLDEIYTYVGRSLGLSITQQKILSDFEINIEISQIVGIPEMIDRFLQLHEKRERLLLISDMYLPRCAIERMVNKVAPNLIEYATLYLSSEHKKKKSTGSLFKHVLQKEKLLPNQLFHIGDNAHSDVKVPVSLGIRCTHYNRSKLSAWEKIGRPAVKSPLKLNKLSPEHQLGWQVAAGKSREQRLSGKSDKFLLGYTVAGPIFLPFVKWVLESARELKIEKIYFAARDGFIFHKIAKSIQSEGRFSEIEVNYLYGSRQSWHFAAIQNIGKHELDWIFESRQHLTCNKIAKRVNVQCEKIIELFTHTERTKIEPGSKLTGDQKKLLRTLISENSELKEEILANASEQNKLLIDYLSKQSFFDGRRNGLVDIGWLGRCQDSLFKCAKIHRSSVAIFGFYFGLVKHTALVNECNRKSGFALCPEDFKKLSNEKTAGIVHLLEILASANHGSTVSYSRHENGHVEPVLDSQGDAIRRWGVYELQNGIVEFCNDHDFHVGSDSAPVINRLQELYIQTRCHIPTKEFADTLGSFPYTTEQEGQNQREFGGKMSAWQAIKYVAQSRRRRSELSLWPEGSAARSNRIARFLLHPKVRRIVGTLIRPTSIVQIVPQTLKRSIYRALPTAIRRCLIGILDD